MKFLLKVCMAVAIVAMFGTSGFSQIKVGPSINAPLALGGDFGDMAQMPGQGYGIEGKYYINKKLAVGLKWRQVRFALEQNQIVDPTDSSQFSGVNLDRGTFNEFMATVEYNFYSDFDETFFVYAGAEGGLASYTLGWEYTQAVDPFENDGASFVTVQETESEIYPCFGAYTGVALPVADLAELRGQVGYNMVMAENESIGFVSVQFGVMFIIGKYWNE